MFSWPWPQDDGLRTMVSGPWLRIVVSGPWSQACGLSPVVFGLWSQGRDLRKLHSLSLVITVKSTRTGGLAVPGVLCPCDPQILSLGR